MLPKRPFHDDVDEDGQGSKRFKNSVVKDVFANFSMEDHFVQKMEPYLRAIVRETVEETVYRVFQQSSRPSSSDQPESSARRGFLLHFVDQLPSTIFTNTNIETEDGNSVQVVLLDVNTKSIVSSGPLSSMKVAVVALDGDFGSDDLEDWSENEFVSKIICQRDGKRPLVAGELVIALKDGVGRIGDVSFSDNSSWIRCRMFRLGVLPVDKNYGDVRVREARSGAFVVKDQRGESYKKHYPPHQNDDIWRLEKIAKDGAYHRRLVSNGIHKLKEFLQFHAADPTRLRKMFEGISNKTWNTIIGHASTCSVDTDELYIYYVKGQGVALLFNSIYKLVGAAFDGHNYKQIDKLTINQMALVENWKEQAYKNTKEFLRISALALFGPSLTITQPEPLNDANIWMQQLECPITRQEQSYTQLEFDKASSSTSYPFEVGTSNHFDIELGQQANITNPAFPTNMSDSFKLGDTFPLVYNEETNWATSTSQWPLVTSSTPRITEEYISGVQTSTRPPFNSTTWGQGTNALILTSSSDGERGIVSSHPSSGVHVSRIRNPKEEWFKLKVALKLRTVMRDVAARRNMAQLLCPDYQTFVSGNQAASQNLGDKRSP